MSVRISYKDLPEDIMKAYHKDIAIIGNVCKVGDEEYRVRTGKMEQVWTLKGGIWVDDEHELFEEFDLTVPQLASFYYKGGTDKTPEIVPIALFDHRTTGNTLLCGINLHYLNEDDKSEFFGRLDSIFATTDIDLRYDEIQRELEYVVQKGYRYYMHHKMSNIIVQDIQIENGI